MAKLVIAGISADYGATASINAAFDDIETAIENTLSRDGTSPNAMSAEIDMSSNSINNLGTPLNNSSAARLQDVLDSATSLTSGSAATTSIADTPDYYKATNVEGALQELGESVQPTKAAVAALTFTSVDAGRKIFITASDGGEFTIEYNATPGTYSDNGGTFTGTEFIPASGDGTIGLIRDYNGTFHEKWFGVKRDNSTDDTNAFNALHTAMSTGDSVLYGSGIALFSGQLKWKEGCKFIGNSPSPDVGTIFKQADSSNVVGGLIVSDGWDTNQTDIDNPIVIRDLLVDANKANNASATTDGLHLMNWNINMFNVGIVNTTGNGLVLTDQTKDNTTVTGTAVENVISHCRITNTDLSGIVVESNGVILTDGKILGCIIGNTGEYGINIIRGSGWQVGAETQVYNTGFDGIAIQNGFNSSIRNCSVQGWGVSATTGLRHACVIYSITTNDRPCQISNNNIVQNTSLTVGSTYYAVGFTSASGVTTAIGAAQSNVVVMNSDSSENFLRVAGSGVSQITATGNSVANVNEDNFITKAASDTVLHLDNSFDSGIRNLPSNGTPSLLQGCNFQTQAGTVTLTDLDDMYVGQTVRLFFAHSAWSVDFSGTNLKGNNGRDWSPEINDFMVCTYDGISKFCKVSTENYVNTATTTELAAIGNAINILGKYTGKQVFNTTTGVTVFASGSGSSSVWNNADGTTAHTPV